MDKLYQLFQQIIIKKNDDSFSDFSFHPLNIIDCFKSISKCSLTQEEVFCFDSPWLNGMFVDLSFNLSFNNITISSIFKELCFNGHFETLQWLYKCDDSCILFNKNEQEEFFIKMCKQPHDTIPHILTWILLKKSFKGFNIHLFNDYPFIMACTHGCILVVKWFLDLNKYNRIMSETFQDGFIWVCRNGYINIIKLLLSYDEDLQINESTIQSGFELACDNNHFDLINLLMGLEGNRKVGWDAIQYGLQEAQDNNNTELLKLLQSHIRFGSF